MLTTLVDTSLVLGYHKNRVIREILAILAVLAIKISRLPPVDLQFTRRALLPSPLQRDRETAYPTHGRPAALRMKVSVKAWGCRDAPEGNHEMDNHLCRDPRSLPADAASGAGTISSAACGPACVLRASPAT
jgi:hypothetical protein